MIDQHDDSTLLRRNPSLTRRIAISVGWLLAGAALALLLVVDPLDFHPVDRWIEEGFGQRHGAGPKAAETGMLWTCGMHPQVIEDEPGPCPICGMDMVPLNRDAGAGQSVPVGPDGETHKGRRKVLYYQNPHDPSVISEVPTKDRMGMDYLPVYADEVDTSQGAVVTIDPTIAQNMNVMTFPVELRDLSREIRTVGYLDYDQQKMVSITTKYSGFIERVYVNYVGEPVKKGQPLFEIYSPQLVQTQEEFLAALSFARRLADAPAEARQRAEKLVEAARTRLGYWDIDEAQIARLEQRGRAMRTLTVATPAGGVVMMRLPGLEGMAVSPGMELFHIADLSTLWLAVEVFEDQLSWLREGSDAEVTLSYFPGEAFRGRVRFVEPQVAEKTRTVGLRLEIPNREGRLRAGMYATVRFTPVVAKQAVAVPSLALIRTGERNLVVVALGGGRYAPREVAVGAQAERFVQILSGLTPGESVVTSAQFMIDSESNLREAIQKLLATKQGSAADAKAALGKTEHVGH